MVKEQMRKTMLTLVKVTVLSESGEIMGGTLIA